MSPNGEAEKQRPSKKPEPKKSEELLGVPSAGPKEKAKATRRKGREVVQKRKKRLKRAREKEIPQFFEGVKKLGRRIDLYRVLPRDIYDNFKKDPNAFEKAIELTEGKPELQRMIVLKAPKMLTKIDPEMFTKDVSQLGKTLNLTKDKPQLLNYIFKKATSLLNNSSPGVALILIDKYAPDLKKPYIKSTILNALKRSRSGLFIKNIFFDTFKSFEKYNNLPYSRQIWLLWATFDPLGTINEFYKKREHPDEQAIVSKAFKQLMTSKPKTVFQLFMLWSREKINQLFLDDPDLAKQIIERGAEKDPDWALISASKYEGQDYYDNVIEQAAQSKSATSYAIFKNCHLFIGKPYAEKALEKAAIKDSGSSLEYVGHFVDEPYAEKIISFLCQKSPAACLEHAEKFSSEKFSSKHFSIQLIKNAGEEDPWAYAQYYENYKNLFPEAEKLYQAAQEVFENKTAAMKIPQNTIKAADLPFDIHKMNLYLKVLNYVSKKTTTTFSTGKGYPLITIPMDSFRKVLFAEAFQEVLKREAGKMTYMNVFSLAQATYRYIERQGESLTKKTIRETAEFILEQWEKVRGRELFGPNTKLILFTHEEGRFDNEKILGKIYERSGGKKENILVSAKGVEMKEGKNVMKEKVLEAIRNSKGPTTILFSGHGSQENWAFAANQANNLSHSLEHEVRNISYRELGDALISSGNIENINLIGSTCLAYDYLQNLFGYLGEKGIEEKLYVSISAANQSKFGWGGGKELNSRLLEAMYLESEEGKPITVDHFFKAEGRVWQHEDPAIFIGNPEQYKPVKPKKGAPVIPKPIKAVEKGKAKAQPEVIKGEEETRPIKPAKDYLEIGMGVTEETEKYA